MSLLSLPLSPPRLTAFQSSPSLLLQPAATTTGVSRIIATRGPAWRRPLRAAATMASNSPPPPPPPPSDTLFAVRCLDAPGALATRQATRPVHLDWAKQPSTAIHFGGMLLSPRSSSSSPSPLGSLLLMSAPDAAALADRLVDDPYAKAGVFARTDALAWRCVRRVEPLPDRLFSVWCVDRDESDAPPLRAATRAAHLAWWEASARCGLIGPFLQPPPADPEAQAQATPIAVGSLIICAGDSEDEVRTWAAGDPYALAGLFESVEVCAFKKSIDDGHVQPPPTA